MNEASRPLRCAIYTRKSTEEGLEQQFNSLHAQREAGEAFILSQRQAGWEALPDRYDDGGFSGASIERPALKKLLTQVEQRSIDCVVVYKVDRLSRSLLDFARLMEQFERCGVSFVSVTQEFNSTTSLGRLTLNILLSFAQFEREIIGERTRDKLSAARRKGKWTGGVPVLGYDVDVRGGRLVVNPEEAGQVRELYRIFLAAGTLEAAVGAAREQGLMTKCWTSQDGNPHLAKPFSSGSLRRLLSNVLYRGSVSHKGTIYPGEHEAIVEPQLWDEVNAQLQANSCHLRGKVHGAQDAPLENLLYCSGCGGSMLPTYTTKGGRKHRYYICRSKRGLGNGKCVKRYVSAADLEAAVAGLLEPVLGDQLSGPVLRQAIDRLIYDGSASHLSVHLRAGTRLEYTLPTPNRGGVRSRSQEPISGRVPRISRLVALAIRFQGLVGEGPMESYRQVAELGHVSRSRISQIMRLADLAPEIQEELLFLPKTMTGPDRICEPAMRELAKIIDWERQRKLFRSLMDSAARR